MLTNTEAGSGGFLEVEKTMHIKRNVSWGRTLAFGLALAAAMTALAADQIRTESGTVEGSVNPDSKVRAFKGIPFAAPPVGKLRWQAPQPPQAWTGVRKTTDFAPRCMQGRIYADMVFRDSGPSEDCLYLNIWTPATSADARLPVMVWIFGGGFQAGAPSEPRQDGEILSKKGVIVVTLNYRLGVFGFFAHPELTKESGHSASGNYGFLDQNAGLQWVQRNIAAFGGDPANVTIFGESAGSMSVSAQIASPLSKGLFKQAIGESGGVFPLTARMPSLSSTEQGGASFATALGAPGLEALRAKSANEILEAALKEKTIHFRPNVDGYFFPENPADIYAAGKQSHVALLAGFNSDEQSASSFLTKQPPTPENYVAKVRATYGSKADEILKLYPGTTEDQVKESARDLASDQFIAYSTWKWIEMQLATGGAPVYRYHFEQAPPQPAGEPTRGAYHSADIEFVFEMLDSKPLPWTSDDKKLSDIVSFYWTNFAKTGDPNASGLPQWPQFRSSDGYQVMHLLEGTSSLKAPQTPPQTFKSAPHAEPDHLRDRYQLLDRIARENESGGGGTTGSR